MLGSTRTNDPEIDVVVADRGPVATNVLAMGSIEWLENATFDQRDHARLVTHRGQLPGATEDTALFAVARSGCRVRGLRCYGPEELLGAWRTPGTAGR